MNVSIPARRLQSGGTSSRTTPPAEPPPPRATEETPAPGASRSSRWTSISSRHVTSQSASRPHNRSARSETPKYKSIRALERVSGFRGSRSAPPRAGSAAHHHQTAGAAAHVTGTLSAPEAAVRRAAAAAVWQVCSCPGAGGPPDSGRGLRELRRLSEFGVARPAPGQSPRDTSPGGQTAGRTAAPLCESA